MSSSSFLSGRPHTRAKEAAEKLANRFRSTHQGLSPEFYCPMFKRV
jgi:hypothetical protein